MKPHTERKSPDLHLIPTPRLIKPRSGHFALPAEVHIVIAPQDGGHTDLFAAERFAIEAETLCGAAFHLSLGQGVDAAHEIRAALDPKFAAHLSEEIRAQAYRLEITPQGITLTAFAQPGLFYAFQTLLQILREVAWKTNPPTNRKSKIKNRKSPGSQLPITNYQLQLPSLTITDHPDFPRRGVYHDTARGKVPKVETLLQLIDDLAHLKYNEFQLYIENNFQFRKHPDMYDHTDPFTAEELLLLDAACRARHMDFVPSLTSLGHFEKILNRPRYRPLAEAEPAQLKAIGATCWHEDAPWSLCVTDPKAKQLLTDMYAEFAPNFSSRQFNICCDEAYDLGKVRSKKLADKIGTGQMYVDWINFCDRLVKTRGSSLTPQDSRLKTIQMWGDIILNHPELIPQLPADATLLEWGYEHDHKFDDHCKIFAERLGAKTQKAETTLNPQLPITNYQLQTRSFYVAPGTSSWLTLSARTQNACGNIHNAATAGLKHGARGILITDWGDHGHQQMLAVSLLPFAYGAAAGWNLAATPNPCELLTPTSKKQKTHIPNYQLPITNYNFSSFLTAISLHLFEDPTAQFAHLAYDLGLTYLRLGWQRFNASLDHFLFREKWDFANYVNRAPAKALKETIKATDRIWGQIFSTRSQRPDAQQLVNEFFLAVHLIMHTCQRTLLRQQWLAADPARRNPEESTLRDKPPKPLPTGFSKQMERLRKDADRFKSLFELHWLARNKRSRLADITAEFDRLVNECKRFTPG